MHNKVVNKYPKGYWKLKEHMKSHPKRFNIRRFLQSFLGYWISFQAVKLIFGYVGEIRFSLAQKKTRVESSNFDLCSGSKHDVNSIFPEKINSESG